jgi:hypothetical protein
MKHSSANPVKTLGGIDSYATSHDQFAVERYIRYKSDPLASHSAITGIAAVFAADATFTKHTPLKSLLSR